MRILLFVISSFFYLQGFSSEFTENKGQWPAHVLARLKSKQGFIYVEKGGFTFQFYQISDQIRNDHGHIKGDPGKLGGYTGQVWKMKFKNPNSTAFGEGSGNLGWYENYFRPNYTGSHCGVFDTFYIRNIYNGIDVQCFTQGQEFKYNLIVKPGVTPQIEWTYEGLEQAPSLVKGELRYQTKMGWVKEKIPFSQYSISGPSKIQYRKVGDAYGFVIPPGQGELMIDPVVVFSSFTGSTGDNWGFTATYDDSGYAYSGGVVFATGYPVSPGAFQTTWGDGVDVNAANGDIARDIAIIKYSPDGSQRIYATYVGGSHNEQPHSMVVNNAGELCVLSTTFSVNFPAVLTTGFQNSVKGQSDIAIFKLSADGSTLKGGTFFGGFKRDGLNGVLDDEDANSSHVSWNYGDIFRGEIICDEQDNLYIATTTESKETEGIVMKNIPGGNGCLTRYLGGTQDGLVAKFNSTLEQLIWSTYLGGIQTDACFGIHLGKYLFVCGGTSSNSATGLNGYQSSFQGAKADGMLYRLNQYSGVIEHGTYIGTSGFEVAFLVQADLNGNPWITGQTTSGSWPVTAPIYVNPNGKQFVTRFTSDLASITRSTVFGSGRTQPDISPSAFLVDKCERIFVSGWGGRVNVVPRGNGGSTGNMPITNNAVQKVTDGSDFYLAVFNRNADTLLYGTYFGGTTPFGSGSQQQTPHEHVDGGTSRFDFQGKVYQSVCGGCGGQSFFPTTPGAWSQVNRSSNCNNALFKIDFENLNFKPSGFDSVFSVYATDTFSFRIASKDLDRFDSLYLYGINHILDSNYNPPPILSADSGLGEVSTVFSWVPDCSKVSSDTQTVKVLIRDNNRCPQPDTNYVTVRLKVQAPPKVVPPKVVCVAHVDDNTVRVTWEEADTSRYFLGYILFRKTPNGLVTALDTFYQGDPMEYMDGATPNHLVENYCYYLKGINLCLQLGDSSYQACSAQELTEPMDSGYVFTATVTNNRYTKIIWQRSTEPDFGAYLLYRITGNGTWDPKTPLKTFSNLMDTSWTDSAVTVSDSVYCYRLRVADRCGHISTFSNVGCTIVLQGKSVRYTHFLDWNLYQGWAMEAERQEVRRSDSTDVFRLLRRTNGSALNMADTSWGYEWGRYQYKIVAYEGRRGKDAYSESNVVTLVQPPVVFVPSAFSPNDDGINDFWGWRSLFVRDFHLTVYTRWGEKVFESFDPQSSWDGKYRNKEGGDQALIYQLNYVGFDDTRHQLRGMVYILY